MNKRKMRRIIYEARNHRSLASRKHRLGRNSLRKILNEEIKLALLEQGVVAAGDDFEAEYKGDYSGESSVFRDEFADIAPDDFLKYIRASLRFALSSAGHDKYGDAYEVVITNPGGEATYDWGVEPGILPEIAIFKLEGQEGGSVERGEQMPHSLGDAIIEDLFDVGGPHPNRYEIMSDEGARLQGGEAFTALMKAIGEGVSTRVNERMITDPQAWAELMKQLGGSLAGSTLLNSPRSADPPPFP